MFIFQQLRFSVDRRLGGPFVEAVRSDEHARTTRVVRAKVANALDRPIIRRDNDFCRSGAVKPRSGERSPAATSYSVALPDLLAILGITDTNSDVWADWHL